MNYRHHFHAGNFADVMKHALLVRLLRELQKKEKGFLYLDTHAGRGRYDLASAATGDSLARKPEWPDGIGRLWTLPERGLPEGLKDYLNLVRDFDRRSGNLEAQPRFYPGSPWIARMLARPADRLALCEKHAADCSALRTEFAGLPRVAVDETDGYSGVRAMLPPPERRALVLIDPPYESQDEFVLITRAVEAGLKRLRSGVFAIWFPLTTRARLDEFFKAVRELNPPSALAAELTVAGESSTLKMKGCGLIVINPPWQFESVATPILQYLSRELAQEPGGGARVEWLVREKERVDNGV
jgi:23S rRNA (adenine2030-N6)-methyltransferase